MYLFQTNPSEIKKLAAAKTHAMPGLLSFIFFYFYTGKVFCLDLTHSLFSFLFGFFNDECNAPVNSKNRSANVDFP